MSLYGQESFAATMFQNRMCDSVLTQKLFVLLVTDIMPFTHYCAGNWCRFRKLLA